jgi:hypothetical protein
MDTKNATISTHSIGDAIDLWATVRLFEEENTHVPPAEIFWDELCESIGTTNPYKRKVLFRLRKRLGTLCDTL